MAARHSHASPGHGRVTQRPVGARVVGQEPDLVLIRSAAGRTNDRNERRPMTHNQTRTRGSADPAARSTTPDRGTGYPPATDSAPESHSTCVPACGFPESSDPR